MKEQLAKQPRPAHTRAATRSYVTSQHEHDDEEPSASPHRAGFTAGLHPEDTSYTSSEQSTRPPASSRLTPRPVPVAVAEAETLDDEDDNDDALYAHHVPNVVRRYDRSVAQQHTQPPRSNATPGTRSMQPAPSQTIVRYHQHIPARISRTTDTQEQHRAPVQDSSTTTHSPEPQGRPVQMRPRLHWLVYVGLIVLAAVGLYVGSSLVVKWWHRHQDDVTYGRPRTYQCDVRVGHNEAHMPSHFLALNLNKQIEIIEFPGGDASKARVYIGPTLDGDGQELTPVTLSFRDVNGDGKPDMILHIGNSQIIYINDNGTFRPAKASDHLTL